MKICKCLNLSDCLIASLKYLRYFYVFFVLGFCLLCIPSDGE